MSFGIFEAAITSEQEVGLARQASVDKMAAAIYDVREKLGPFLFAARDLGEFRDRVALCKNDQSLFKIIARHIPPITGTVRRIAGKNGSLEREFRTMLAERDMYDPEPELAGKHMKPEDAPSYNAYQWALRGKNRPTESVPGAKHEGLSPFEDFMTASFDGEVDTKNTFKPSDADLVPQDNWDGYRNKVDQNSSKVDRNFTAECDPMISDCVKAPDTGALGNVLFPGSATGQEDDSFQGAGPKKASMAVTLYRDWCEANGQSPMRLSSLDRYADRLSDLDYMRLAKQIEDWEHEYKPKTPKGQGKDKLKDVTAGNLPGDHSFGDGGLLEPAVMSGAMTGQEDTPEFNPGPRSVPIQGGRRSGGEHSINNYPRSDSDPRHKWDDRTTRYTDPTVMGPDDVDPMAQALTDEEGVRKYPELPRHRAPEHEARRDPMRAYTAWCQANGLKRISARNVEYFAGKDSRLAIHLARRMKQAIHTARLRQGSYRTAAPDYLQKADDALTQLLNQKAEEFQQTIAPLQQALVTVQQAEQLQQQQNPMNVVPPAGTVNVMPGGDAPQDPSAALGGAPGGDPMAAAAALAGMGGGGAPDGGGGAMPTDQGAPPPAAAGGGLPPELQQQMMQARRQAGRSECSSCGAAFTGPNPDKMLASHKQNCSEAKADKRQARRQGGGLPKG